MCRLTTAHHVISIQQNPHQHLLCAVHELAVYPVADGDVKLLQLAVAESRQDMEQG